VAAASSSAGDAREPELEDQRGGQQHTDHGYERKRVHRCLLPLLLVHRLSGARLIDRLYS
jgi:hypothetical protein